MSYMRHHAIVVTSFVPGRVRLARKAAKGLGCVSSKVTYSGLNGCESLFVAPDGSKEDWPESDTGDARRASFIAWLNSQRYDDGSSPYAWVEVQYGHSDDKPSVVSHGGRE